MIILVDGNRFCLKTTICKKVVEMGNSLLSKYGRFELYDTFGDCKKTMHDDYKCISHLLRMNDKLLELAKVKDVIYVVDGFSISEPMRHLFQTGRELYSGAIEMIEDMSNTLIGKSLFFMCLNTDAEVIYRHFSIPDNYDMARNYYRGGNIRNFYECHPELYKKFKYYRLGSDSYRDSNVARSLTEYLLSHINFKEVNI